MEYFQKRGNKHYFALTMSELAFPAIFKNDWWARQFIEWARKIDSSIVMRDQHLEVCCARTSLSIMLIPSNISQYRNFPDDSLAYQHSCISYYATFVAIFSDVEFMLMWPNSRLCIKQLIRLSITNLCL